MKTLNVKFYLPESAYNITDDTYLFLRPVYLDGKLTGVVDCVIKHDILVIPYDLYDNDENFNLEIEHILNLNKCKLIGLTITS